MSCEIKIKNRCQSCNNTYNAIPVSCVKKSGITIDLITYYELTQETEYSLLTYYWHYKRVSVDL